MKRIISFLIVFTMVLSMASCTGETTQQEDKMLSITTIEQLEETITKDITDTQTALTTEYESLVTEIDTYEKYEKNIDKVQAFYNKILDESNKLSIRMREYSTIYVEIVMASDMQYKEKEKAIEDMYDLICDDASDDIYDAICDDLMGDMFDAFYDGVVSDGYDYAPYKKWSDVLSDSYDMWSDCSSDVYDIWSDLQSDIYDFWSDVSDAMWDGDEEEVDKEVEAFKADIEEMKNPEKTEEN